jgi:hypothetical protein
VDYALWGLRPVGYHLTNLILHAANTVWVWWLLRCYRAAPWLALLAALVFAVHPVHTEAVANVVGRAELLGMCFGGLMWWSWVQARWDTERAGWWRALAAAGYLAAMLSKENMVVLPRRCGWQRYCARGIVSGAQAGRHGGPRRALSSGW